MLYDDLVLETDLPGRFVRRLLAEADPRAGPPSLHASPALPTTAPGHLVETSTALQLAAAPKPPPKQNRKKAPRPSKPEETEDALLDRLIEANVLLPFQSYAKDLFGRSVSVSMTLATTETE